SSRVRGIGGLDFRTKIRPRDVFYVVVDLFFCWKQRASAKSCSVYCLAVFLCPGAAIKNADGFRADRVANVRMVAGSRLNIISARSDSHRAVLCDGGGVGLITIWFQNRGIGEEEVVIGSFPRRLVNAGLAIWWYAGKVCLPTRLMAIYPRW